MTLIPHRFNDKEILQASEGEDINGVFVPKGYVNVSQICRVGKKMLKDYLKNKSTLSFFAALVEAESQSQDGRRILPPDNHSTFSGSKTFGISSGLLVEVLDEIGGSGCVYAHPEVAIDVTQWVSPEFRVWANRTLRLILQGDFGEGLTDEAKQAKERLEKIWQEAREETKETFWFLTDSIKEYYEKFPKEEKYSGQHYSEVLDTLNLYLFDKRSKEIKSELGIKKGDLNRDHFGKRSLERIKEIQKVAKNQIAIGNHPVEAVKFAVSVFGYKPINYND